MREFVTLKFIPAPQRPAAAALLLLLMAGCSGSKPIPRVLPGNIMAHPRGTIGVIAPLERSDLLVALRALGVPYSRIPLADFARHDLTPYTVMMVDEEAMEYTETLQAYNRLLAHTSKNGTTLIVMTQQTKTLLKAGAGVPLKLSPRDLEYQVVLAPSLRGDPVIERPNQLTRADLDSVSKRTGQLVFGGENGRAILAANLQAPDSSAALFWEPLGKGSVWYLSFPVTAHAAAGYEAEQKLIANLVSNK